LIFPARSDEILVLLNVVMKYDQLIAATDIGMHIVVAERQFDAAGNLSGS